MTTSRNLREGHYRGHQRGTHYRSLTKWIVLVHAIDTTPRRAPAGILKCTRAYLAEQLAAIEITGITGKHMHATALEVVRYVMDIIPDDPTYRRDSLAPAFERVVDLVVAWEQEHYPLGG
jgi:hypothetical protein